MSDNPFKILGLSPEALAGRSDSQIRALVKGLGRTLSQLDHPDVKGDERRFRRTQEALTALEDNEAFKRYKTAYLRPLKTKLAKQEEELALLSGQLEALRDQRIDYLTTIAGRVPAPSVTNLAGYTLSVTDVVHGERTGGAVKLRKKGEEPMTQLRYESDGTVLITPQGGKETISTRWPVGVIPNQVTSKMGRSIKSIVTACQPSADANVPMIRGRTAAKPLRDYRIPLQSAEPILSLLVPRIAQYGYLFSLTGTKEEPHLYFEGSVHRIIPPDG